MYLTFFAAQMKMFVSNFPPFSIIFHSTVVDKTIEKILKKHFPSEKPPVSVVRIRVAPEDVDVNLEPNKQTVILRFAKDVEVAFDNVVSEHFGKARVGGEQESADAASAPAAEASAALQGTARSPAATADPANSMSISTFNFEILFIRFVLLVTQFELLTS